MTAVDNYIDDAVDPQVQITHAITSLDPAYNSAPTEHAQVRVLDDDATKIGLKVLNRPVVEEGSPTYVQLTLSRRLVAGEEAVFSIMLTSADTGVKMSTAYGGVRRGAVLSSAGGPDLSPELVLRPVHNTGEVSVRQFDILPERLNRGYWEVTLRGPQTHTALLYADYPGDDGDTADETITAQFIAARTVMFRSNLSGGISLNYKPQTIRVTDDDSLTVPHDWPQIPHGLNAGDKFRLLLATAETAASSSHIGKYDSFAMSEVSNGLDSIKSYTSEFKALVSTSVTNLKTHNGLTGAGVPIYWVASSPVASNKVADDYTDFLDGSWDQEQSPTGADGVARSPSTGGYWTGSNSDGTTRTGFEMGRSRAGLGFLNRPSAINPLGSTASAASDDTDGRPIYVLSPVFTVGESPRVASVDAGPTITEGSPAVFRVTLSHEFPTNEMVIGELADASNGADFLSPKVEEIAKFGNIRLLIAGLTSVQFREDTVGDNVDEPNGTISLRLKGPDESVANYVVDSDASTASVTVLDDDPTSVTLTRAVGAGIYEGSTLDYTLSLGRALVAGESLSVPLTFNSGDGAATRGTDYELACPTTLPTGVTCANLNSGNASVTFTGGPQSAQSVTITLAAISDDLTESSGEVVDIGLGTLNAKSGTNLGGGAAGTDNAEPLTINDEVGPTVEFAAATYAGTEATANRSVTVTISASPAPAADLEVAYTISGTATSASDYTALSGTAIIAAGATSTTITVAVSDDAIDEPSETVILTLAADKDYQFGTQKSATVAISDDDATQVTLSRSSGSAITEGSSLEYGLTLGRALVAGESLSVPLDFVGTATRNIDYQLACPTPLPKGVSCSNLNSGNASVTFTGSATAEKAVNITLTATKDATSETDGETVNVNLATLDPNSGTNLDGGVTTTDNAGVLTINDPAPLPKISITAGPAVTEGTAALFTVRISPTPKNRLNVNLLVADASGGGEYLSASTRSLTSQSFPATTESGYLLATEADIKDEPDGDVTVTLRPGSGYLIDSDANSASVTVRDDDATSITLSASTTDVDEASGVKDFTISLERTLVGDEVATVPLTVTGANVVDDFTWSLHPTSQTGVSLITTAPHSAQNPAVQLAAGASSAILRFTPVNNDVRTQPHVTVAYGTGARVPTGTNLDIDTPSGGPFSFVITDDENGAVVVPIDWPLLPSGLSHGDEFRLLFITSGKRNATATDISVYDNFVQSHVADGAASLVPYAGFFRVVGSTASVDARDHLGANPATDGTGETIYWLDGDKVADDYTDFWNTDWDDTSTPTYADGTVPSTQARFFWTGTQIGGAGRTGAELGSSFVGGGSLTKQHESITPIRGFRSANDGIAPFYGLSMPFTVEAEPITPTLSVTAGEPVTEGDPIVFTITASTAPKTQLRFYVHGADASNGGDYIPSGFEGAGTNMSGTIPAGETSGSFKIYTLSDRLDEPDGTVTLTLRSGSGYVIDSSASAASTIVRDDDDPPTISLQVVIDHDEPRLRSSVVEGGGAKTVGVIARIEGVNRFGLAQSVDVEVGALGDSAVEGVDYESVPDQTIVIAAGEAGGQTIFTLTPKSDAFDEVTELISVKGSLDGVKVKHTSVGLIDANPTSVTLEGLFKRENLAEGSRRDFDLRLGRSLVKGESLTVPLTFSGSATRGTDYTLKCVNLVHIDGVSCANLNSGDASVKFTGPVLGKNAVLIQLDAVSDSIVEASGETVDVGLGTLTRVGLDGGVKAVDDAASLTINDPRLVLPKLSLTAGDAVTEGSTVWYTLKADPRTEKPLNLQVSITDTEGSKTTTSVPIRGEFATTKVGFTANADKVDKPDGKMTVTLLESDGYTVAHRAKTASVIVLDGNPTSVTLTRPAGAAITEGSTLNYTLTLGRALAKGESLKVPLTFNSDDAAATRGTDYTLACKTNQPKLVSCANLNSGDASVTFTGGARSPSSVKIALTTNTDSTKEGNGETIDIGLGELDANSGSNLSGGATGIDNADVVIILEKEPAQVALTAVTDPGVTGRSQQVAEDRGAKTVRVTATIVGDTPFGLDAKIAVTVGNTNDSATEGTDYDTVPDLSITIPAGKSSGYVDFVLTPTADNLDEGFETVTISGRSVGVAVGVLESNVFWSRPASLFIIDTKDTVTQLILSFDADTNTAGTQGFVREDGGTKTVKVTASIVGPKRFTQDVSFALFVGANLGDSAVEGTDYQEVVDQREVIRKDGPKLQDQNVLTIKAGRASGSVKFALTPIDDTLDEQVERLSLSLLIPSDDLGFRADAVMLPIFDNDGKTPVRLLAVAGNIAEDTGSKDIVVALERALTGFETVTVPLTVTGVTVTDDYTLTLQPASQIGVTLLTAAPHSNQNPAVRLTAGASQAVLRFTPVDNDLRTQPYASISLGTQSRAPSSSGGVTLETPSGGPVGFVIVDDETGPITVPSTWPLKPAEASAGGTFRLLFTTSGSRDATSTDISVYDGFVQSYAAAGHAAIAPYAGFFRAVASTATVDADAHNDADVTDDGTGEAIYWLDGEKVADNYADFWDNSWHDTTSPTTEDGTVVDLSDAAVYKNYWTGTGTDGNHFSGGELGRGTAGIGELGSDFPGTGPLSSVRVANDRTLPFYGLSQPLTVAPATNVQVKLSVSNNGDVTEGGTLMVTATLSEAPSEDIRIPIRVGSDSTGSPADYSMSADSIVILSGATSGTAMFTASEDGFDEPSEMVALQSEDLPVGYSDGTPADLMVTIIDDNPTPEIDLSVNPTTVDEGDGATTVTVTATIDHETIRFDTDRTVVVSVAGSGNSGVVGFDAVTDFDVTIFAGDRTGTATFTLTPQSDNIDETDETITVSGSVSEVTVNSAELSLTDDDAMPSITLSVDTDSSTEGAQSSIGEGAGAKTVRVTATIDGTTRLVTAQKITVAVGADGDTAIESTDYETVATQTITIAPGAASGFTTFTLTPTDDSLDEPSQSLSIVGSGVEGVTFNNTSVTITDNDLTPEINLSVNLTRIAEVVGATPVKVTATIDDEWVRFDTDRTVVVSVAGSGNSGVVGFDAVTDFDVTIFAGDRTGTATFTLTPQSDNIDEADEIVTVSGSVSEVTVNSAEIRLTDDPVPPVILTVDADTGTSGVQSTIAEGGGAKTVRVTVAFDGATLTTSQVITVAVGAATDTAVEGTDYETVADQTVTIAPGAASGTVDFTLTPIDDSLDEPSLSLSITGGGIAGTTFTNTSVTITDNDPTVVSLVRVDSGAIVEDSSASAADRSVEFTVSLGRALVAGEQIDVPLVLSGSGVVADDYSLALKTGGSLNAGVTLSKAATLAPTVTFAGAAAQTATLVLTAVDDSVDEGDAETLTVALGDLTDTSLGTNVGGGAEPSDDNDAATDDNTFDVSITDDDDPVVTVSLSVSNSGSVTEGGTLTVTATLVSAASAGVTIPVRVASVGTAAAGDYSLSNSGDITISSGSKTGTLTLSAVNDDVDEVTEKLTLELGTLPDGYTAGSPSSVDVTITDDDVTIVSLSALSVGGVLYANAPTKLLKVSLSRGLVAGETLKVPVVFSGATLGDSFSVRCFALPQTEASCGDFSTAAKSFITFTGPTSAGASGQLLVSYMDDDNDVDETLVISVPTSSTSGAVRLGATGFSDGVAGTGSVSLVLDDPGDNEEIEVRLSGGGVIDGSISSGPGSEAEVVVELSRPLVDGERASVALAFDDKETFPARAVVLGDSTTPANLLYFTWAASGDGVSASGSAETLTLTFTGSDSDAVKRATLKFVSTGQETSTHLLKVEESSDNEHELVIITADSDNSNWRISPRLNLVPYDDDDADTLDDATARVLITDDDVTTWQVSFTDTDDAALTAASVTEDDDFVFNVALPDGVTGPVTIPLTYTHGTTVAADFDALPTSVFVPYGAESATVTISPANDSINESDETLTVSAGTAPPGFTTTGATFTLTLADDDGVGVTITESSGSTSVSENAGTDAYTVVLDSQPTHSVTVTITSGTPAAAVVDGPDVGDVGGATETLTFTTSNWNRAQIVTVTGVNDDVDNTADKRTVTLTHAVTSSDAKYNAVANQNVTVTVVDDDATPEVDLSVNPASVGEGDGATTVTVTATVDDATVRFDAAKTVRVSVDGSGGSGVVGFTAVNDFDLTIAAGAKTGTATFELTPQDDSVDETNETVTVSGTLAGVTVNSATLTLADDDGVGVTITESSGSTSVSENAGTDAYTVVLDSQPTHSVTVTITSGTPAAAVVDGPDVGDVGGATETLTFTTSNWNRAQIVTVTGVNDDVDNTADKRTVTLTHAVTSSDAKYNAVANQNVTVTVVDDDATPEVDLSVNPASVGEGDGATTVTVTATVDDATVRFDAAKTVRVSVDGSGGSGVVGFTAVNDFDLTIAAGAKTGTATFELTPQDDSVDETNETVTVSGTLAGVTVNSATLTLADDDGVGVTITESSGSTSVSENAGTDAYTVVLDSQPTHSVTVTITSGTPAAALIDGPDVGDVGGATETLTFTTSSWATAQTVTVTGVNDDVDNTANKRTVTLTHAVTSSDAKYNAVANQTVAVTVIDDDATPEVDLSVNPASVGEGDGATTVTVTATVDDATVRFDAAKTVRVSVDGSGGSGVVGFTAVNDFDLTIAAGAKTGTATFELTPQDDSVDETNETVTVSGTLAGVTVNSATLTLADDDGVGVTITESSGSTSVSENAGTDAYTVVLDSQPTHSVTVTITSGTPAAALIDGPDVGDVGGATETLTFTTSSWATAQTVTVTGVNDDVDNTANKRTVTLTHAVTSSDAKYNAVANQTVAVTVIDDDATPEVDLSVNPASVGEGDGATTVTVTATVDDATVRFDAAKTVRVSVDGSGGSGVVGFTAVNDFDLTIAAGAKTGTATFELTPQDDSVDETNETVTVSGTLAGVTVNSATLTLADDDGPSEIPEPDGDPVPGDGDPVPEPGGDPVPEPGDGDPVPEPGDGDPVPEPGDGDPVPEPGDGDPVLNDGTARLSADDVVVTPSCKRSASPCFFIREGQKRTYKVKLPSRPQPGQTYAIVPVQSHKYINKYNKWVQDMMFDPPRLEWTHDNWPAKQVQTVTVSAPPDDDVGSGQFVISHRFVGFSGTQPTDATQHSTAISAYVFDSDRVTLVMKDSDGNVIDGDHTMALSPGGSDWYSVELSHDPLSKKTLRVDSLYKNEDGWVHAQNHPVSIKRGAPLTEYPNNGSTPTTFDRIQFCSPFNAEVLSCSGPRWNEPQKIYVTAWTQSDYASFEPRCRTDIAACWVITNGFNEGKTTQKVIVDIRDPSDSDSTTYTVSAGLIADVRGYAAETINGEAHVRRWKRVLVAFGVDVPDFDGEAMSAAEAKQHAQTFWGGRWDPIVVALTKLEAQTASDKDDPKPSNPEVSISAGGDITEGAAASFTVKASPLPAAPLDVSVKVAVSGDFGVTVGTRTVTIPVTGSVILTVATTGDSKDETDGSVTVTVIDGASYDLDSSASAATVNIADDDDPPPSNPEVSISADGDITEGAAASFTVKASPLPAAPLDVSVKVAVSGDFGVTVGTRTVTIPVTGSVILTVATTGDSKDETDGSVTVTVIDGASYDLDSSASAATVNIADDDDPPPPPNVPSFSIRDGTYTEGQQFGYYFFYVELNKAVSRSTRVWYTIEATGSGTGHATAGDDFTSRSGWITFRPGLLRNVGVVAVKNDSITEPDETFRIVLSKPQGAVIGRGTATITIKDDD